VLEPERKLFDPDFTVIKNGRKHPKHSTFTYIYSGYHIGEHCNATTLAHGVKGGRGGRKGRGEGRRGGGRGGGGKQGITLQIVMTSCGI
jgi:hypothetical protein